MRTHEREDAPLAKTREEPGGGERTKHRNEKGPRWTSSSEGPTMTVASCCWQQHRRSSHQPEATGGRPGEDHNTPPRLDPPPAAQTGAPTHRPAVAALPLKARPVERLERPRPQEPGWRRRVRHAPELPHREAAAHGVGGARPSTVQSWISIQRKSSRRPGERPSQEGSDAKRATGPGARYPPGMGTQNRESGPPIPAAPPSRGAFLRRLLPVRQAQHGHPAAPPPGVPSGGDRRGGQARPWEPLWGPLGEPVPRCQPKPPGAGRVSQKAPQDR